MGCSADNAVGAPQAGADKAPPHLPPRAADCLTVAASGRLFIATVLRARCCHAVAVTGTGASSGPPLRAWRDCCAGPSEISPEAGEGGRASGAISQGLFGCETSLLRLSMTETSAAGIDSGPSLAPNPAPWRLVVQAAWPVMAASVQTTRPKGALGAHVSCQSGKALALRV